MSHCFRIRFVLPDGITFNHDEPSADLEIPESNDNYLLRTPGGGGSIKDSSELLLIGSRFETEEEATAAGKKAKDALALAAGQNRIGLDLGKDRVSGGMSDYAKAATFEEFGVRVLNDVHGLLVYDEETPTRFISTRGSLNVLKLLPPFVEAFRGATTSDFELTDRGRLALELYGLSHFESSPHVRFLMLVMVVEVLAPPNPRHKQAIEHVETLMQFTSKFGLDEATISSMLGSLERLKKESISASARQLVEKYLGADTYAEKPAKKFFGECYGTRSKLMHEGKVPENNSEFSRTTSEIDRLVADLFPRWEEPSSE